MVDETMMSSPLPPPLAASVFMFCFVFRRRRVIVQEPGSRSPALPLDGTDPIPPLSFLTQRTLFFLLFAGLRAVPRDGRHHVARLHGAERGRPALWERQLAVPREVDAHALRVQEAALPHHVRAAHDPDAPGHGRGLRAQGDPELRHLLLRGGRGVGGRLPPGAELRRDARVPRGLLLPQQRLRDQHGHGRAVPRRRHRLARRGLRDAHDPRGRQRCFRRVPGHQMAREIAVRESKPVSWRP